MTPKKQRSATIGPRRDSEKDRRRGKNGLLYFNTIKMNGWTPFPRAEILPPLHRWIQPVKTFCAIRCRCRCRCRCDVRFFALAFLLNHIEQRFALERSHRWQEPIKWWKIEMFSLSAKFTARTDYILRGSLFPSSQFASFLRARNAKYENQLIIIF